MKSFNKGRANFYINDNNTNNPDIFHNTINLQINQRYYELLPPSFLTPNLHLSHLHSHRVLQQNTFVDQRRYFDLINQLVYVTQPEDLQIRKDQGFPSHLILQRALQLYYIRYTSQRKRKRTRRHPNNRQNLD